MLGRREPGVEHLKLTSHVVDFKALSPLPPLDGVYLALGTTIEAACSHAAFRAVDFDANLTVARALLARVPSAQGRVVVLSGEMQE